MCTAATHWCRLPYRPTSENLLRPPSPPSAYGPRASELCGSHRPRPSSPWNLPSSACGRPLFASRALSRYPHPPAAPAAPCAARWVGQPLAWRRAKPSPVYHTGALNKHEKAPLQIITKWKSLVHICLHVYTINCRSVLWNFPCGYVDGDFHKNRELCYQIKDGWLNLLDDEQNINL